jgi:hypothetical protein
MIAANVKWWNARETHETLASPFDSEDPPDECAESGVLNFIGSSPENYLSTSRATVRAAAERE